MNGLAVLTVEALLDAVRRRLALVVAGVCLLSILMLDSCTGSLPSSMTLNGEQVDIGTTVAGGDHDVQRAAEAEPCRLHGDRQASREVARAEHDDAG